MKVICAWCVNEGRSGDMGEKPPHDDRSTTHGMCPECLGRWRDLLGFRREGSLDLANLSGWPDLSGV